jgi:hypothetical protein
MTTMSTLKVLTGEEKSVKQDELPNGEHPLCLQKQILISGLMTDGSCPCSLQKSPGDQMDVSGLDGFDDTPLLAGA